ncbi:MAG: hypothetical protein LLG04_01205 [Parachlamydia sp.]|nr:hypothetical protein [Parachlamydia sp.]
MASSTKEVKKELETALAEIGEIKPWFEKKFKIWLYSHPLYPVECEGKSREEVLKKYPKYLEVFIEHRMKGKIDALSEKNTKGKGGFRPGAGRPIGTTKEPTRQIRVPQDIAEWLKMPGVLTQVRSLMQAQKHL